jgi:phosphoglycolate phosphatase-like HAD superfamily hydrolase
MTHQIEAILFDMGGTLRRTAKRTRAEKHQVIQGMMNLVSAQGSVEEFTRLLSRRAKAYKHWAEQTHIELNEHDLWTKWMLPDFPLKQIGDMAIQLNQLHREATGARVIFPETREVVLELFRRGYRLGLVSNTTSSVEVPALLKELEITVFEAVILSAVANENPTAILLMRPAWDRFEHCAYVGDHRPRCGSCAKRILHSDHPARSTSAAFG